MPRMQTSVSSVTPDKPKLKDTETASGRQEEEMERKGNVGFLELAAVCVSRPWSGHHPR